MSITRTITLDDLSPAEIAYAFAEMNDEQQAQFFSEVGRIAATWPGAGMCQQAYAIADHLDASGTYVIERLADHAGVVREVPA